MVDNSAGVTPKLVITSASIADISASLSDEVTVLATSKVATSPVIDGFILGTIVVGAGTGFIVGLAVTRTAHEIHDINFDEKIYSLIQPKILDFQIQQQIEHLPLRRQSLIRTHQSLLPTPSRFHHSK